MCVWRRDERGNLGERRLRCRQPAGWRLMGMERWCAVVVVVAAAASRVTGMWRLLYCVYIYDRV